MSKTTGDHILMLVPHEPHLDPRVMWAIDMCVRLAPTRVLHYQPTPRTPSLRYDGRLLMEAITPLDPTSKIFAEAAADLYAPYRDAAVWAEVARLLIEEPARCERPSGFDVADVSAALRQAAHYRAADPTYFRFVFDTLVSLSNMSVSMHARTRAESIVPRAVLCHDIMALLPALRLKDLFGCPVVYDSHEIWHHALEAIFDREWEAAFMFQIERLLLPRVDQVITVNTKIARYFEQRYGLDHVVSTPNAEPWHDYARPSFTRPVGDPVRFLLQGNVARGRGIDELVRLWVEMDDSRTVLMVRAPENPLVAGLREKHADAVARGLIEFPPPVKEAELIAAASLADVGVIPYPGPCLNHVFACPNKLGQYMQAGLPILYNCDLQYVHEVVSACQGGIVYDPSRPETLRDAVRRLVEHPDELLAMKKRCHAYARDVYNWEQESREYEATLRAYHSRTVPAERRQPLLR